MSAKEQQPQTTGETVARLQQTKSDMVLTQARPHDESICLVSIMPTNMQEIEVHVSGHKHTRNDFDALRQLVNFILKFTNSILMNLHAAYQMLHLKLHVTLWPQYSEHTLVTF